LLTKASSEPICSRPHASRLGEHGDEHIALWHAWQARGVAQADLDMALVCSFMRAPARMKDDSAIEDVHQTLADASSHQTECPFPEVPNRADAGAHQMRRRVDRAARQHHLAAAEFLFPAADLRLDADAARALEQQLPD